MDTFSDINEIVLCRMAVVWIYEDNILLLFTHLLTVIYTIYFYQRFLNPNGFSFFFLGEENLMLFFHSKRNEFLYPTSKPKIITF